MGGRGGAGRTKSQAWEFSVGSSKRRLERITNADGSVKYLLHGASSDVIEYSEKTGEFALKEATRYFGAKPVNSGKSKREPEKKSTVESRRKEPAQKAAYNFTAPSGTRFVLSSPDGSTRKLTKAEVSNMLTKEQVNGMISTYKKDPLTLNSIFKGQSTGFIVLEEAPKKRRR